MPKKDCTWLRRASALAEQHAEDVGHNGLKYHAQGGRRPVNTVCGTPDKFLVRSRGQQGAPLKTPEIREHLWDWFVDIRRSFSSIVSPKYVLSKARHFAKVVLAHQRQTRHFTALPTLDKHWLLRWKRDYGVVFRHPNQRFKCSKAMLQGRLRAMWRNTFVVRFLAQHFLGHDLSQSFWGVDEKPIHFNESGSKNARTLELVGAPEVQLKQNHAATRERVSIMTCVTSRPGAQLPLELLFRAQTPFRTSGLKVPADHIAAKNMPVTFQWAPKGSYRQEHLIHYLGHVLDPWTDARAASRDYRVMMMDVARSHVDTEVTDFAWLRGYVVLYHYGHTTGVCQVNDTDCHAAFEREYMEVEQVFFNYQQWHAPGDVNRRPQDVVNDACETWRKINHESSRLGHWRVGLTNALNGDEDKMMRGQAEKCWNDEAMWNVRTEARLEVEAAVKDGTVKSFEDWRALVRHPVDPGVLHSEGSELESQLEENELPWLDAAGEREVSMDEKDVNRVEDPPSGATAASVDPSLSGASAASLPSLEELGTSMNTSADAVAQAKLEAARLATLRSLRVDCMKVNMPCVRQAADRMIQQIERGQKAKTSAENEANLLLRRHLELHRDEEIQKRDAARNASQALQTKERQNKMAIARAKTKAKADNLKLRLKKVAEKEAVEAWRKDMESVPLRFNAASMGVTAEGLKERVKFLDRLKMLSPDLPHGLELRWDRLKNDYAERVPKVFMVCGKPAAVVGPAFFDEVEDIIQQLGPHFKGYVRKKLGKRVAPLEGNALAFVKYCHVMHSRLHWGSQSLEM